MAASGSTKVIIISLVSNFTIAVSKLLGSLYTSSSALMSEAIHSFADCCNQLILLYGANEAKKESCDKYPLGRDKEIFFWSFIVAFLLFTIGGVYSLYEGMHKLADPHPINQPYVGIIILAVGVVVEAYSFWECYKEVINSPDYRNLWQWIKETHAVDLLVIALENLAAILGLLIALAAMLISWLSGDGIWDAIGSIAIGVLLIITALVLAIELKQMLIGQSANSNYQFLLSELVEDFLPGAKILNLIAIQRGISSVMLAYKVHPGDLSDLNQAISKLNEFEAQVKIKYPEIRWQFAELDVEK